MKLVKYQIVLLHNDCMRMLRRPSKTSIVDDIMYTLFTIKQSNNESNNRDNRNYSKKSLYETILSICGCNNME